MPDSHLIPVVDYPRRAAFLAGGVGDGYYAFIDVEEFCEPGQNSDDIGEILAQQHGVAVVPGVHFSDAGRFWIRFSYAMPVERTVGAYKRMDEGLKARV